MKLIFFLFKTIKGYHLTFSLASLDKLEKLKTWLQSFGKIEIEKFYGKEIQFLLSFDIAAHFGEIFNQIETRRSEFDIDSFGLSITTMDEIFLQVTEKSKKIDESENDSKIDEKFESDLKKELSTPIDLLEGFDLIKSQFLGAFLKCRLHALRNWKIILMQLLLPTMMTVISIVQILTIPKIGHQPSLDLSLKPYRDMSGLNIKVPFTSYQTFELSESIINAYDTDAMTENLTSEPLQKIGVSCERYLF